MSALDLSLLPRGNAFLNVSDVGRRTLDRWLVASSGTSRTPGQVAISKAATTWSGVKGNLDRIAPILDELPDQIALIRANKDLNGEATKRLINERVDGTQSQLASITSAANTGLTRIEDTLRKAATPPRPGNDVTTEARIAGAKADLKMVLDAVGPDVMKLAGKMAELAARAHGDGDDITMWVLAGSRWPADYAATRVAGLTDQQISDVLDAAIGEAVDALSGSDMCDARRVYSAVASIDGTWALEEVLGQVAGLVDDVREWALRRTPDSALGLLIAEARAAGRL